MLNDICQKEPPHSEFTRERVEVEGRRPLRNRIRLLTRNQILPRSIQPLQHLSGHLITLRMDPCGVERLDPTANLEEPHRLDKCRLTEARYIEELPAGRKRTVLGPPFMQVTGRRLIQARHIAEQRWASRIHIDTHVVYTALHHGIERSMQMPRLDVVLVEPHADVGGLNLHQFREGILQPPAN